MHTIDFERSPEEILREVLAVRPIIVGFSLIFQLYIDRFDRVIRFLRDAGVDVHFTMGGHFASLSSERTLNLLPGLDSVVRFEGEHTLLDLATTIAGGDDWHAIDGIAYRQDGAVTSNAMRPLVSDLDTLPFPERNCKPATVFGKRLMQIIASRGCARTCSFCSIHTFYRTAPGKVVRTRKPSEVVSEMRQLYDERAITIFTFQDDDFPLFGPVWHRWTRELLAELHHNDLPGKVIWKINCRADAVDPELFAEMRNAGLYFVYMGLESGTEEGLKTLNKRLTVEHNLRAVEMLKALDLAFEFGFMLFDPSTSFDSIAENLAFLKRVIGDGSDALSFCRMIPYDGTPIRDQLALEGRLRGTVTAPDYDFLDPRIDNLYLAVRKFVEVTGWVHALHGVSGMLNYARNEAAIAERLFPPLSGIDEYKSKLRDLTRDSNAVFFELLDDLAGEFAGKGRAAWTIDKLRGLGDEFKAHMLRERDVFVKLNQSVMLEALGRELTVPITQEPVTA